LPSGLPVCQGLSFIMHYLRDESRRLGESVWKRLSECRMLGVGAGERGGRERKREREQERDGEKDREIEKENESEEKSERVRGR